MFHSLISRVKVSVVLVALVEVGQQGGVGGVRVVMEGLVFRVPLFAGRALLGPG